MKNRRYILILISIMIIGAAFHIVEEKSVVKGTGSEEKIVDLNHTFMLKKFYALSDIINLKEDGKEYSPYGRNFGSDGEKLASIYIEDWLIEAGLESNDITTYDVSSDIWPIICKWRKVILDGYWCRYEGQLNRRPTPIEWYLKVYENNASTPFLNLTGTYVENNIKYMDCYPLLNQNRINQLRGESSICLSDVRILEEYKQEFDGDQIILLKEDWEIPYGWMSDIPKIGMQPKVKAYILRDDDGYSFFDDTIFMGCSDRTLKQLSGISISGSDGELIADKLDAGSYIDADMKVEWSYESVESTTVVGEIEGEDEDTIIVISSHLDGHWNQASFDESVGASTMLGIIEYMCEHDITPKYTIHFCFWSGHEWGDRGLKQYLLDYWDYNPKDWSYRSDKTLKHAISLGNYGFNSLIFEFDNPEFQINCYDSVLQKEMRGLAEYFEFTERTGDVLGDNNKIDLYQGLGTMGGECCYCFYGTKLCNYPIKFDCFPYPGYHRDGNYHTEGDVNSSVNESLLEIENEIIAKTILFLTVDPDCWFDGEPTVDVSDSDVDQNDIADSVNVTFTIETSMPDDRVKVIGSLIPWGFRGFFIPRVIKEYAIHNTSSITDTFTFNLPTFALFDLYKLELELYNSTGVAKTSILRKYYDDYYYKFLDLGSPNDSPNTPNTPYKCGEISKCKFKLCTNTTDPNNDQVYYQWCYEYKKSKNNDDNTFSDQYESVTPACVECGNNPESTNVAVTWKHDESAPVTGTIIRKHYDWEGPYDSGEKASHYFSLSKKGNYKFMVRAKDEQNCMSDWSNPKSISISDNDVDYDPVVYDEYHSYPILTVNALPGEPIDFLGNTNEINLEGGNYSLNYNMSDDCEYDNEKNVTHNFSQTGIYTVTFTVSNETDSYNYSMNFSIQYVLADFNASHTSIQTNETVYLNDTSKAVSEYEILNWTWNLGDGNISYNQNISHNYTCDGIYNVTLTITDNQSHNDTYYQYVYVDSVAPNIMPFPYLPYNLGLGQNETIYVDVFDNISKVETVKINITTPANTTYNLTMEQSNRTCYDYYLLFNDTWQTGTYNFSVWLMDNAENCNTSETMYSFFINNLFGNPYIGYHNQTIKDRITGSIFQIHENGTAEFIETYLYANTTNPNCTTKGMIHRVNDSQLVATTEEINNTQIQNYTWVRFNFTGPKPNLKKNTEYILSCWSNDTTCQISYYNYTDNSSYYLNETFGSSPSQFNLTNNESRLYPILCYYTPKAEIKNISDTPDCIGFGFDVNITAEISNEYNGVEDTRVIINGPSNLSWNVSMEHYENNSYYLPFNETWNVGQYDYSIMTTDRNFRHTFSDQYSYNVSGQANISICTIKDSYGSNETINITDPPVTSNSGQIQDGWEVMERGNTWNTYYDPVSDEYHTTCYTDLINYQNETGVYLPINTSVKMESATVNDEQFEYGVTKGAYQTFWKQNTNDQEDESLVMLKDGWMLTQKPDSELVISYNKAQSVHTIGVKTTSQASVQGNALSYADQYQCQGMTTGFADMQYEYQPSLLKANLVLTNPSFLSNRFQTVKQFLDEDRLWLGYATTLFASSEDNTSATMGIMVDDAIIRGFGNTTTGEIWTEEQIWFTDDTDNPVLGIPELYARDSQGNETVLMKHLTFDENGEIRISIYTPMSWLTDSKREYPVYVDPSVSVYSETGDGWALQDDSTNWDTVHDGSGSNSRDWDTSNYGVVASCGVTDKYSVRRAFFRFNTTDAIPDETVITGASLNIRGALPGFPPPYPAPIASGVVFQKWTGGGTVSNGDYNDFTGSYYGSKASWSTFNYNSIPWIYSRDEINLDGFTDVCLREWAHDYNDSAPGGETSYSNKMVFADSGSNKPYLSISYQYPPAITGVTPANNTINVSITPTLSITVNHTNGDNMTITWSNKINSTWQEFASNTTNGNETCHQTYDNATENGQWWEWKVNVTNGTAYREKEYRFYAGVQSKINNSGSTDIAGYLWAFIQYYNETSGNWTYDFNVIDGNLITVNSSEEFGIDTVFNGLLNSDYLYYNGTYRIYVMLLDPEGNVLVCDDDTKLEATYEFEYSEG